MSGVAIFISHGAPSALEAPRAHAIRVDLFAMFRNLDGPPRKLPYEPFVDEGIEPGELWRPTIFRALSGCQGAVVLLDPRAKSRPWVVNELMMLRFRRFFQNDFPLLVVEIDDPGVPLNDDAFERTQRYAELLEPLQDSEYERMRLPATISAKAAAKKIFQWFGSRRFCDPNPAPWVCTMKRRLGQLTADPGLLRDVAAALKDSLDKEDRDEITRLTGSDVAINLPDWAACVQSDGVLSALATRLYAMPPTENRFLINVLAGATSGTDHGRFLAFLLYPLWVDPANVVAVFSVLRNGGAANAVPLIAIQLPHGLKEDNERDLAYRVLKRVSFEFRSDDEFRIAEVADLDPLDGRKEDRPDKAEKIILDIARLGLQLGDVARDIVLAHLNEWADKGNYLVCLLPPEWTDGVILERLKEFRGILVAIYGSWTINELNRMVSPLSIEKLHCVIQGEQFRHCIYARQILCNLAETNSASKRSYWWLNRNP